MGEMHAKKMSSGRGENGRRLKKLCAARACRRPGAVFIFLAGVYRCGITMAAGSSPVSIGNGIAFRRRCAQEKGMVYQKQILLETRGHRHLHDLTADVARIVHDSGVRTGTAHVFNVGSTGALGAIEYEPGLLEDLPDLLDKLIPPGRDYGHEQAWHDGNGHSHLQATLLGPSLTVPVADRKPVLGTWQQIFHLECDIKPRRRTIVVTVSGE